MKEVFLIMVENKTMKTSYVDSVWENKKDAEIHLHWLKNELLERSCEYASRIETKQVYKHIG